MVPFRAWRYSPQAGELSRLVAPPYDVVDDGLQAELYARSPHNVVRVDLGVGEASDDQADNRYTRAAACLKGWKGAGVLVRDVEPTVTFVQETFTGPDGVAGQRHGVLAAMRLTEFGEGVVFPHEHTLTGPKEDRFRLMDATAMSLSPVFLLYDLPGDDITAAWRESLAPLPPASTVQDLAGNTTCLWATADNALLSLVRDRLAGVRLLIADGHHRYETALRYQQAAPAARAITKDESLAVDYCLVYLANKSDPALTIYPTHRLLHGLPEESVHGLPEALAHTFEVERLALRPAREVTSEGGAARAAAAQQAVVEYLKGHQRGAFGVWSPRFDAPYGVRLTDLAASHVSAEYSEAYQELDVAILQALVFDRALGISPQDMAAEKHVAYFKDTTEAFARLEADEFQVGFFMNPTGLDQVCEVAFGGERMPQKTTFFYPKLPTGLVFHDLEGRL